MKTYIQEIAQALLLSIPYYFIVKIGLIESWGWPVLQDNLSIVSFITWYLSFTAFWGLKAITEYKNRTNAGKGLHPVLWVIHSVFIGLAAYSIGWILFLRATLELIFYLIRARKS